MSREVFMAAIDEERESISIGGGEPTLHPLFWEFLMTAVAKVSSVWLATNGSNTEISLVLADLARKGIIGCALSQDMWHDPIDARVVQAFTKERTDRYVVDDVATRSIRNVEANVVGVGRALENELMSGIGNRCVCASMIVRPDGDVMYCGCPDAPCLGNILTSYDPHDPEVCCIKEREPELVGESE